MRNGIDLSVIIPAYNESKRIGATLDSIKRYLYFSAPAGLRYEIIVVDDGSRDDTSRVVKEFAESFPGLRLIEHAENRGKGHAVKTGMEKACGAYRLYMDADNSVKIGAVERFLDAMRGSSCDIVIGSIAHEGSRTIEHNGWHRRLLGKITKAIVGLVTASGVSDTQRGFKLFSARAADEIFALQKIERFGFDIELLVIAQKHGYAVKEMPVVWDNPAGSKVGLRSYIDSSVELMFIYWNTVTGKYNRTV